MKKKRMNDEEWAEFEAQAEENLRRLRERVVHGRAELEAKRKAEEERRARRRRFFLFR